MEQRRPFIPKPSRKGLFDEEDGSTNVSGREADYEERLRKESRRENWRPSLGPDRQNDSYTQRANPRHRGKGDPVIPLANSYHFLPRNNAGLNGIPPRAPYGPGFQLQHDIPPPPQPPPGMGHSTRNYSTHFGQMSQGPVIRAPAPPPLPEETLISANRTAMEAVAALTLQVNQLKERLDHQEDKYGTEIEKAVAKTEEVTVETLKNVCVERELRREAETEEKLLLLEEKIETKIQEAMDTRMKLQWTTAYELIKNEIQKARDEVEVIRRTQIEEDMKRVERDRKQQEDERVQMEVEIREKLDQERAELEEQQKAERRRLQDIIRHAKQQVRNEIKEAKQRKREAREERRRIYLQIKAKVQAEQEEESQRLTAISVLTPLKPRCCSSYLPTPQRSHSRPSNGTQSGTDEIPAPLTPPTVSSAPGVGDRQSGEDYGTEDEDESFPDDGDSTSSPPRWRSKTTSTCRHTSESDSEASGQDGTRDYGDEGQENGGENRLEGGRDYSDRPDQDEIWRSQVQALCEQMIPVIDAAADFRTHQLFHKLPQNCPVVLGCDEKARLFAKKLPDGLWALQDGNTAYLRSPWHGSLEAEDNHFRGSRHSETRSTPRNPRQKEKRRSRDVGLRGAAIHESDHQDHKDAAIVPSPDRTTQMANYDEFELPEHASDDEEGGQSSHDEGVSISSWKNLKPGIRAEIESILNPSLSQISKTTDGMEGNPPSIGPNHTARSNRTGESASGRNGKTR